MIRFGGKDITIKQNSGAVIDGEGSRWWDGEGTNGGKTKPKFMYAHSLEDSTITGLSIKNTPVQAISVQATNLYLIDITIDNSDGDDNGGHNTDGFDISESTGVYIRGATVKNQDDCIAINSGEVCSPFFFSFLFFFSRRLALKLIDSRTSNSPVVPALAATVSPLARLAVATTTPSRTSPSPTPP